jgi:aminoglycoside phosphotransferase (APT) family kinase protein
LLRYLRQQGLAAPQVLACEEDPAICGAPFMLVEPIAGASDPAMWNDRAQVRSVVLQIAEFLAKLHAVPVTHFVENTPTWLDPGRMCRSVAGMRKAWQRIGVSPQPMMEAVLAWLERNEPTAGRAVIVHGDIGLYNLLVDNGRVSGVLDWEMSHLGQAEEDLLCVRTFMGDAIAWPELIDAYRSHGGHYEPTGGGHFYRVFALARIALSLFNILHSARHLDPTLDTKEAYIGPRFCHRVLLDAFQLITSTPDLSVTGH